MGDMMRHVAVFTWKPGTTAEQVRAFAEGLAALPAQIPEIRAYRFGPDAGLAAGNGDFALVADFDDGDAWRAYQDHPVHQRFIAEHARPIVEARHAVQHRVE
jgi:hypothetical protein